MAKVSYQIHPLGKRNFLQWLLLEISDPKCHKDLLYYLVWNRLKTITVLTGKFWIMSSAISTRVHIAAFELCHIWLLIFFLHRCLDLLDKCTNKGLFQINHLILQKPSHLSFCFWFPTKTNDILFIKWFLPFLSKVFYSIPLFCT